MFIHSYYLNLGGGWISPSTTKIRHVKSDIKEFTEMVDELRTKNVAKNTDYSWKIISILYI